MVDSMNYGEDKLPGNPANYFQAFQALVKYLKIIPSFSNVISGSTYTFMKFLAKDKKNYFYYNMPKFEKGIFLRVHTMESPWTPGVALTWRQVPHDLSPVSG